MHTVPALQDAGLLANHNLINGEWLGSCSGATFSVHGESIEGI